MQVDALRDCFLGFPEVTEETPFDEHTVVYKTAGKMFALIDWEQKPLRMNLKCDPLLAEELRDQYPCVVPGYHMNKKHWNTVFIDGSVSDEQLGEWVCHSFEKVVAGMSKNLREKLLEKREKGEKSSSPEQLDNIRQDIRRNI